MPPSSSPSVAKVPAAARSMRAAAVDRAGEIDVVDLARARSASRCRRGSARGSGTARRAGRRLSNASAKRSPTSSVCAACLRITALPAISAGTIELTAVRIGIVPRRDHHHDAERLARDHSGGSRPCRLGADRRQRRLGDRRSCSASVPRRRASRRHSGSAGPSARRAPARSRRSLPSSASTKWSSELARARATVTSRPRLAAPPCALLDRASSISAPLGDRPLGIDRARRWAR